MKANTNINLNVEIQLLFNKILIPHINSTTFYICLYLYYIIFISFIIEYVDINIL